MAKRGADGAAKVKKRRARAFDLGEPGAIISFEYPLGTRGEVFWSFVTPLLFIVGGGASAVFLTGSLGVWIALGVVALGLFLLYLALVKPSGTLVLDATHVRLGPPKRTRNIALADVTHVGRGLVGFDPSGLEQLVITFSQPANSKLAAGVALVPRAVADELAKRIILRARALQTNDPRALEAAETRYLAGASVIGVFLVRGKWHPFSDTRELSSAAGAHPFRSAADRIPICVSPAVRDAILTVPELEARVEPIVVPD